MTTKMTGAMLLQAGLWLAFSGTAMAQDDPDDVFVYATYFHCDATQQKRADEIFESIQQPAYEDAIKDGDILNYLVYSHHTGGKWRRGVFFTAPSVQALLDAQDKIGEAIDADDENAGPMQEYGKICNSHTDYIWRRVAGTAGTAPPGKAAFSVYYVCDGREAQADALVEQVFAPVYDQMVADKKLTSWGYLEHIVGGKIRRVATMNAKDLPALMTARGELIEALIDNPLGATFNDMCNSHDDYIWNVSASGDR